MRERYLVIKVTLIAWLIRLKILKNVWYQSEIDLAEIRAKKMAELFGWDD